MEIVRALAITDTNYDGALDHRDPLAKGGQGLPFIQIILEDEYDLSLPSGPTNLRIYGSGLGAKVSDPRDCAFGCFGPMGLHFFALFPLPTDSPPPAI